MRKDVMQTKAYKRFQIQLAAHHKGDMATVRQLAEEARQELIDKGYVPAEPLKRWIKKKWLDKGLQEGVIVKTSKGYFPVADEVVEEKVISIRGRTPITERKTTKSYKRFDDFCKRMEADERENEDEN